MAEDSQEAKERGRFRITIGIIDADLIGRARHQFPNLACMKMSGHYKQSGNQVELLSSYHNIQQYDKVFISKVFTDTPCPQEALDAPNVEHGGTGFFYDKAPPLRAEIEHAFPDYHLYDYYVAQMSGNLDAYTKASIGFLTRGCFRKCKFCVNKNCNRAYINSPLAEFYDAARPYIILLDDNVLSHLQWRTLIENLKETGKRFTFKQGMDIRLLTPEKAQIFADAKHLGDYTFAFDNIADADMICRRLALWREYNPSASTKLYCFCAFDRDGKWDCNFWKSDIESVFARIVMLAEYKCLPYVMRFSRYEESPYRGMYITLARWANQPGFLKKKSFREFCIANGENSAAYRYMLEFGMSCPEIASKYFDWKWGCVNINSVGVSQCSLVEGPITTNRTGAYYA